MSRGNTTRTPWLGLLLGAGALIVSGAVGVVGKKGPTEISRRLQDGASVGLGNFAGLATTSVGAGSTGDSSVQEGLTEALESDPQCTVVGDVTIGELLCDTLSEAEDAPSLTFPISSSEAVTAEKSSYVVIDGGAFADGVTRKVWTGVDVDNSFRTVSMSWTDDCNVEMFLLKITTANEDGSMSVVKSVPCDAGTSTDICLVEVDLVLDDPVEAELPDGGDLSGSTRRQLRPAARGNKILTRSAEGVTTAGRSLQSSVQVTVMLMYTESALASLGFISESQMQTHLAEALAGTNQGMENSDINLEMALVYVGPLPDSMATTSSLNDLYTLPDAEDVGILRDMYAADLVQVIGGPYLEGCGRGYLFTGDASYGFSVTGANCLTGFTHTHEFGHNFGCQHNREDTTRVTDYAHGWRYCEGDYRYNTIMSYRSCGTYRVNYFSNPEVDYLGLPTGTSTADNARAIEDTMAIVSNYRTAVTAPTPAPVSVNDCHIPNCRHDTSDGSNDYAIHCETCLVDASERTTVSVRANAYDPDTSIDNGCDPDGCVAAYTRDGDLTGDSRWACEYGLKDKKCRLTYKMDSPQDIVEIRIAFYKGDERTRSFLVKTWTDDGTKKTKKFTSSGETEGFETFELDTDETVKLQITPASPNTLDWLTIYEVGLMVR